jgi:uncharacterized membrane protein YfcA
MLYPYGITLLILCPLIFLGAFIDSIAGGGGLITLPSYIFVGLPIHTAYGTNKFPASMGLATATVNYLRSGCVDFSAAVSGGVSAFIGSLIGTRLALSLSPRALQLSLMIILPLVGVFVLSKRRTHTEKKPPLAFRLKIVICSAIGLVFGCYDGFFGPGAGMFMAIALSGLVRLDLIKSVGTAKLINFSSNFTSMITWLVNGKILFTIAVPCMICSVAGGFLGSRMAIKAGNKFIRLVLVVVVILLFSKIVWDLGILQNLFIHRGS